MDEATKRRSDGGTKGRLAGAVLVGGRSSRMGTPKHLVRLPDGRLMIEHVAAALRPLCESIVVVGGTGDEVLADSRHLPDRRPGAGPLAGVESLLASGLAEQYLVCPCDMPCITVELLSVLASPGDRDAAVLRIAGERGMRPLPAWFSAHALESVRAALDAENRSVRDLLRCMDAEVREIPEEWEPLLRNVNTPEDLGT